jgi:HAD superfamily hydrolase (TIGR01509 family)
MRPALLFDIDGTLVDTEAQHLAAFQGVFATHGVALSEADYFGRIMGAPNVAIAAAFLPHLAPEAAKQAMLNKEIAYRGLLGSSRLTPATGIHDLLDRANALGIVLAAVTNAPRMNAELVLGAAGLAHRFPTLIISDELARGKPDPLPYLTALDRLGANAEKSLAFEDSPSGLKSAVGAGLATVGLTTTLTSEQVHALGAVRAIRDFADPWVLDRVASLT